ncbi:MAG: hypothetical protein IAE77_27565 [Prosthecobacter sp.]|jgi:hypothetical protein|uniref:hypothetical protein n=1 Tax=Prosthecobacter sp. TaxID=1965333 RepID=UPI0019E3DA9F|nr:hypothetical protein [Prosthecobacter sp.]MBE2287244.1 hypothetical protein [Prosthecobacter sp.]
MSTVADDFLTWATDSSRTLEERFGILRLVECVYSRYYRGPDKRPVNYEAERHRLEDRRYNAVFEPVWDDEDLRLAAGLLPQVLEIDLHQYSNDRPLRDLGFLRFVPHLTSLKLAQIEVESLDILRHLPALRSFQALLMDRVEDYSALASCRELTALHVQGQHPWPVFSGLESLPLLEDVAWHLPLRAFTEIPRLPAVKRLDLSCWNSDSLVGCLRDFHQLPEMPLLEHFWGGGFYRLEGIERFPRLRTARISGFFRTLAPIARMPALTHLRIVCDELRDIAAAAVMPRLHQFVLRSIRPQDWTPLMESTTLREVLTDGCETPQPDFDTLQIVLPSRDDVFAVSTPRPLPLLRLFSFDRQCKDRSLVPPDDGFPDGPAGWDGCHFMRQSEEWWFTDLLRESLREAGLLKLPGVRVGFGSRRRDRPSTATHGKPVIAYRHITLRLLRTEAISHLRDLVKAARTALSRTRFPWQVNLILNAEVDADEWDEDWRDSDDSPQERAMEHLRDEQQREREQERLRLFLADQHRLALLQEQGTTPAPGDIGPRRLPPARPLPPVFQPPAEPGSPGQQDDDDEAFSSDDNEGGIAEAEPGQDDGEDESWLPQVELSDPNFRWNQLTLFLTLTEDALWCPTHRGDIEAASYLMDLPIKQPPGSGSAPA